MTFMRTRSGMANLNAFHRKDLILYVEGREEGARAAERPDVKFYIGLFAALRPNLRVKVKCVGNKAAVQDYLRRIEGGAIVGSRVAVDRDTSGIDFTGLDSKFQIVTFGYSWESDFWSSRLVLAVGRMISGGGLNAEWESWILKVLSNGQKRLKVLCALDVAGRPSGCQALLPKKKVGFSVSLSRKKIYPITRVEVSRICSKFKKSVAYNCPVCREVFWLAMKCKSGSVIQGHLWEHFVFRVIGSYAKLHLRLSSIENDLLRLVGFSIFEQRAGELLVDGGLKHYESELKRCLV